MQDKVEKLIKLAYKEWKKGQALFSEHPNEEALACFLENRLSEEENEVIKTHLITCRNCAEVIALQMELIAPRKEIVPVELLNRVKGIVAGAIDKITVLEVLLKLKERVLEILNTNGDILVGQELVPAPVLRSRQIKEFKDEIIIFKDFKNVRVELKVENKEGRFFNLTVIIKDKLAHKIIKDLRISLINGDLELESYHTDTGAVTFEHVLLGRYTIEITSIEDKLAIITLDIKT